VGDWAFVKRVGAEPTSQPDVDTAEIVLQAKYYVPTLWAALVEPSEARDSIAGGRAWFHCRPFAAAKRLTRLYSGTAGDAFFSTVWEGCVPVADALVHIDSNSYIVLDVREVAAIDDSARFREQFVHEVEAIAALAAAWSREAAGALLPDWLPRDDIRAASRAARRWTRETSQRAAFFSLAFGQVAHDDLPRQRWQHWVDAGPAVDPLPSAEEDAVVLKDILTRDRVVRFTEGDAADRAIIQFLVIALRERTPEVLKEVLGIMHAQGVVREWKPAMSGLAAALRALDEGVAS
jgi:hypothetical protein